MLRITSERAFVVKEDVCACFIAWKKESGGLGEVYGNVKRNGVGFSELDLYLEQKVRLDHGETNTVNIGKDIRLAW